MEKSVIIVHNNVDMPVLYYTIHQHICLIHKLAFTTQRHVSTNISQLIFKMNKKSYIISIQHVGDIHHYFLTSCEAEYPVAHHRSFCSDRIRCYKVASSHTAPNDP